MDFRIAFFSEFSKDEAQIRQWYGFIPNRSDAGVFKVRISMVWHQFPPEQDKVTGQQLGVACLVNFLDSLTGGREKFSQNNAYKCRHKRPKNITQDSVDTIELFAFKLYWSANRNRHNVFILLQIDQH